MDEIKEKARLLEPVIRIGKNGFNQNVLEEIVKLLNKRKLIKIKILTNAEIVDKNAFALDVAAKTESVLVSRIGNTFVLWKH